MNDNENKKHVQKKLNEAFESQTFSKNFAALRESKRLTKKQMADLLSVSPTTVAAYEAGEKSPSLSIAATIARKCNVSLDWLCGIVPGKINRNIITHRDVIERLLQLSKLTNIRVSIVPSPDPYSESAWGQILIPDPVITGFMQDWEKVKQLYDDGTIDGSLYEPWIAKQLSDYDYLPIDYEDRNR